MSGSKGKPRAKRKGRDLERLVALVEKVLGPQAEVRSPDHLPDRDTSELREVDVSIRLQVGSTPVLIIGECRDRKAVQDSTWIEQLAEKAKSVGAARALAVSRSGFYEPAIAKAKARGVEVRQLKSLTAVSVLEAVRLSGFRMMIGRSTVLDGTVLVEAVRGVDDPVLLERELKALTRTIAAPSFNRKSDGLELSLLDIWNRVAGEQRRLGNDLYERVPEDGTRVRRQFVVQLPEAWAEVRLSTGRAHPLRAIQVSVEFWYEVSEVEPATAYAYTSAKETLVETIKYNLDLTAIGGNREEIAIHHLVETNEIGITRRQVEQDEQWQEDSPRGRALPPEEAVAEDGLKDAPTCTTAHRQPGRKET